MIAAACVLCHCRVPPRKRRYSAPDELLNWIEPKRIRREPRAVPTDLPTELFSDVVACLDRGSIERSGHADRRLRGVSAKLIASGQVPIRAIRSVRVIRRNLYSFIFAELADDSGKKELELIDVVDKGDVFELLEYTLKHSSVEELTIVGGNKFDLWTFDSKDWQRLMACLRTSTIPDFRLHDLNLCPLSADDFKMITAIAGVREVFVRRCRLRSIHVDNELLRRFSEGKAEDLSMFLTLSMPVDRVAYDVDDAGIMQFVFSGDGKHKRSLFIHYAGASSQLPQKVTETRAQLEDAGNDTVHFCVGPVPPENEDVVRGLDFTRHDDDGKRVMYTCRELQLGFVFTSSDLMPCMFGLF